MKQEYLFQIKEKKSEIEGLHFEGVKLEIETISQSDCWILRLLTEGDNESNAKTLSTAHDVIIKAYTPTVLENGCAAYFNRRLFPLFNDFERTLRKLLYLRSELSKDVAGVDTIADLESKDLGEIFTLLFTDTIFNKSVRQVIIQKSWQFTKKEVLEAIQNIEEKPIWDHLLGHETVPALRDDFITVKNYRNDVMHAHNINFQTYKKAKNLIKKINKQIDDEISAAIGRKLTNKQTITEINFNVLYAAVEAVYSKMMAYFNSAEYKQTMDSYHASMAEFREYALSNMEEWKMVGESLKELDIPDISHSNDLTIDALQQCTEIQEGNTNADT